MQNDPHGTFRKQLPGIILLGALAAAFSAWSLDHDVKSIIIYLQGAAFLFFMLVLAQHSRMVAYVLLPTILCGWFSYDGLYDVAGFFLQDNSLKNLFITLVYHQHYLRQTYDISVLATLIIIMKGGIMFGAIYCVRSFLRPVIFYNHKLTWVISGCATLFFLILLPLGIIPH